MTQTHWRIRLGAEAEKDFARILNYTKDNFGPRHVEIYRETLIEALALLEGGRTCRAAPRVMKSKRECVPFMSRGEGVAGDISSCTELPSAT